MSYKKETRRAKKRTRNNSRKKLRRIAEIDRILAGEPAQIVKYKYDPRWDWDNLRWVGG
jgi:hypothetical protein